MSSTRWAWLENMYICTIGFPNGLPLSYRCILLLMWYTCCTLVLFVVLKLRYYPHLWTLILTNKYHLLPYSRCNLPPAVVYNKQTSAPGQFHFHSSGHTLLTKYVIQVSNYHVQALWTPPPILPSHPLLPPTSGAHSTSQRTTAHKSCPIDSNNWPWTWNLGRRGEFDLNNWNLGRTTAPPSPLPRDWDWLRA